MYGFKGQLKNQNCNDFVKNCQNAIHKMCFVQSELKMRHKNNARSMR